MVEDADDSDDSGDSGGDETISAYAPAYVARVPSAEKDKLSAVLVARARGFLVVRVTFHKDPVEGRKVKFSKAGDDGKPGEQVGDETKTNADGIASVPFMVPVALYAVEIEGQLPTVVTTVASPSIPYPIVTPIDRPYFDVDEEHEWDVDTEEEAGGVTSDDDSAADDEDEDDEDESQDQGADAGGG